MLLLACAGPAPTPHPLMSAPTRAARSSLPPNWGLADSDASCMREAVETAMRIEVAFAEAYDGFAGALLPYASSIPIPDACAHRVSIYVGSREDVSVTVCARITTGPGAGRNVCMAVAETAAEQTRAALTDPTEPGATGDAETHIPDLAVDVAAGFDATRWPRRVVIDETDGRVLFDLGTGEIRRCARDLLAEVRNAERSYDAAFDGYSPVFATIGWRIADARQDCDAYVGAKLVTATWPELLIHAVLLEGAQAGLILAMDEEGAAFVDGYTAPDRAALDADGWTLGDALP